jgi:DNA-directed RNA polymerase specialized sigma24 family protein
VSAASRRPRLGRRALATASHAPVAGSARARIAAALACCSETERHIVALLVEERLSVSETALALGLPVGEVVRVRSTLLNELRRVLRGRPFRSAGRTAAGAVGLRRAS